MTSEAVREIITSSSPVLLLFCGIPASGKTSFYHAILECLGMEYISLDVLRTRAREWSAFDKALTARRSIVVDNTNVTRVFRARYLGPARASGYRTIGLFFQSVLSDCLSRNELREGKARLPRKALFGMSSQLELPSPDEGFDCLFFVRLTNGDFQIEPWKET